jgi:hypothetical protein
MDADVSGKALMERDEIDTIRALLTSNPRPV